MESLQHLKNEQKNPYYQDIIINENWPEDSSEDNPQLWEALTSSSPSNNGSALHVLLLHPLRQISLRTRTGIRQ